MSPASCPALAAALALLLAPAAFAAGPGHHGGHAARHAPAPPVVQVARPAPPPARAVAPVVAHRVAHAPSHATRPWTPKPGFRRDHDRHPHWWRGRQALAYGGGPVYAWQPTPAPAPEPAVERVIQYVPVERPLTSDYAEPPLRYYFSCAGPAVIHAQGARAKHPRRHAGHRAPQVIYGLHSPCGARQARAAWVD